MTTLTTPWIPPGALGTAATLRLMRTIVQRAGQDAQVVQWAREIAQETSPMGQVRAIDQWMRGHFVFQPDPQVVQGVPLEDYLIDPAVALQRDRQGLPVLGDCDDAAILVATFGQAVGRPAKFRAVGFDGLFGPLSHVYTLLRLDHQWARLDVTRPGGVTLPLPDRTIELEV